MQNSIWRMYERQSMCGDACRLTTAELSWGEVVGATGSLFNGQQTMAQLLNAQGDLRRPLLFGPGEQYCYTNANFNIAAYIVEKVISCRSCAVHNHTLKASGFSLKSNTAIQSPLWTRQAYRQGLQP